MAFGKPCITKGPTNTLQQPLITRAACRETRLHSRASTNRGLETLSPPSSSACNSQPSPCSQNTLSNLRARRAENVWARLNWWTFQEWRLGSTTFTNNHANYQLLGRKSSSPAPYFKICTNTGLAESPFSLHLFQFNETNGPARRLQGLILQCCSRGAEGVLQS